MKRVIWSAHAKADLEDAVVYRATDSVRAAESLDANIRDAVGRLAQFNSGRVGRIDEEAVRVLRILHGSRYWPHGDWPPD